LYIIIALGGVLVEEDVTTATKNADIHEFIKTLEEGYNTMVENSAG